MGVVKAAWCDFEEVIGKRTIRAKIQQDLKNNWQTVGKSQIIAGFLSSE